MLCGLCAFLYFDGVSLYKISLSNWPNSFTERFLSKYFMQPPQTFLHAAMLDFQFSKFQILTVERATRLNMRHGAEFRGDRSNRCWDSLWRFLDFPRWQPIPSFWICDARVWTTDEQYLVVVVAVQYLVGIGVGVLNTCAFQHPVWLENAYSRPF